MRKISIRNLIIVLLCITVICMAIGFAVMSIRMESYKEKKESFDVVFTKVKEDTSVKGGKMIPTCKNSLEDKNHSVNMNFTLYEPLDELAYTLVIKNVGTLDAVIVDIIKIPDYINDSDKKASIFPVTITTTDVAGKVLSPGEELEIKVIAVYNQTANIKTINIPYKLSLITKSV